MASYSINETCSCGAQFIFSETVNDYYNSKIAYEHERFLEAHENCRTKAVITSGKELKMFLATKPVTPN